MAKPGDAALSALGEYLRTQRRLANLTLRELSELTNVSNPYLSQVERGLHRPSVQVLTSLAKALDLSAETLFAHAAGLRQEEERGDSSDNDTEIAIRNDPHLDSAQKEALLAVYRSYRAASAPGERAGGPRGSRPGSVNED
jgi:transcriptional regulator with XRE-family HTH domain